MKFLLIALLILSCAGSVFAQDGATPQQSAPLMSMVPSETFPGDSTGIAPAAPAQPAAPVVPAKPVSKDGTQTGGDCKVDADCMIGCFTDKNAPKGATCVSKKEGSDMCIRDRFIVPDEHSCGCLPDIHQCGLLSHDAVHH